MRLFSSYAKWILSGEHTVTRGGKAIAFPLRNYQCSVKYAPSNNLDVHHENMESQYNEIFIELLQKSASFLNISFKEIQGKFSVVNNIKMQSGLGSSAAICANIANIFKHLGFINDAFSLAKHLEDKFHQKSSGVDVAVAILNKTIVFQNNRIQKVLNIPFWPHLILSYSGEKSSTSKCINVVKEVINKNNSLAAELDSTMNYASNLCELGLINSSFDQLKNGISIGNEVFKRWGLHNDSLSIHINTLLQNGAVAAKPIGSGLGGYVVSLWEGKPKKHNDIYLTLEKP